VCVWVWVEQVNPYIASIRACKVGVMLISPPPHHDIYSIEDLAQLIYDLHQINPNAKVRVTSARRPRHRPPMPPTSPLPLLLITPMGPSDGVAWQVSVKLVGQVGIGTVASGVAKADADVIQISGHDGGTGASPLTSVKHAGGPWELGLAEAHQQLVLNGLRDRVVLRVDGGLKTGYDVIMGALLGADEFGFGTIAMISVGCIAARICHTNNCPVGVTTQKEKLRKKFVGVPSDMFNFFTYAAEEVRQCLAALGYSSMSELVGRSDLLVQRETKLAKTAPRVLRYVQQIPTLKSADERECVKELDYVHAQANTLDDELLARDDVRMPTAHPRCPHTVPAHSLLYCTPAAHTARASHCPRSPFHTCALSSLWRAHCVWYLSSQVHAAIFDHEHRVVESPISNIDRSASARITGVIAKEHGNRGWRGSLHLIYTGCAGQSFGFACLPGLDLEVRAQTAPAQLSRLIPSHPIPSHPTPSHPIAPHPILQVRGDANDYVGKSMHGGRIRIRPVDCIDGREIGFEASESVICGNTCLYGATGGRFFASGRVGERFCVRNSNAQAVVEGAGDHCCEYMTGGVVVVIGPVGRNVGAGQTGGWGYFLEDGEGYSLDGRINADVNVQPVNAVGGAQLRALLEEHVEATGSKKAANILANWEEFLPKFRHVYPSSEKDAPEVSGVLEEVAEPVAV
jgi:glutamate synthase domain-containing protein 3